MAKEPAAWPPHMDVPDRDPDFRMMTEKDLRRGLTQLNRCIREMKKDSDRYFFGIQEAIELRKRFKIVWRARPGRAFHDVVARKRREHERKHGPDGPFIAPFGM
jgi:hypothetical protein